MEFFVGSLFGFVLAFVAIRFNDRRVDRDIEARLMALDRERIRRIFRRHVTPCHRCSGRGFDAFNEEAAVRDPEWAER
jgi:hypothetical protein